MEETECECGEKECDCYEVIFEVDPDFEDMLNDE